MDEVGRIRRLVQARAGRSGGSRGSSARKTIRPHLAGPSPACPCRPCTRPVLERVQARPDALLPSRRGGPTAPYRLVAERLHELVFAYGHALGATLVKP